MIKNREVISMNEALEYVESENGKEIISFIKKFVKLNPSKSKELSKKIEGLNLMKLKQENIAKIIEILPETNEELNKSFADINLDEDETKKILELIKEYK